MLSANDVKKFHTHTIRTHKYIDKHIIEIQFSTLFNENCRLPSPSIKDYTSFKNFTPFDSIRFDSIFFWLVAVECLNM